MADNKNKPVRKTVFAPSGADWIARLLSFGSILIAVAALYYNALAPADMVVNFISPEFQFQTRGDKSVVSLPGGVTGTKSNSMFLLIADCSFANNGVQIGNVSSVAVQLTSDDGTSWLFSAYKILDDAERIKYPDGGLGYEFNKLPNFSPIFLPGKQTAHHKFLFLMGSKDDVVLVPHKFHVNLWVWYGSSPTPHKQQLSTLDFNEYVVAVLKTGAMSTVPFDEERDQIKQLNEMK